MRVLWLCNFMLPVVAEHLGKEATNKEGWLSGLAAQVLERAGENDITLAAAFPVGEDLLENKEDIFEKTISAHEGTLCCYGFYENTDRPEQYDEALETRLKKNNRPVSAGCGALLWNGISAYPCHVQKLSEKRQASCGHSGTCERVCQCLFCQSS